MTRPSRRREATTDGIHDGGIGPIYRKRVLTPFLVVVALLAGCATSLPKIEPEKLPEAPAQFKENWTIASPPWRRSAASGGRCSTIRCWTASSRAGAQVWYPGCCRTPCAGARGGAHHRCRPRAAGERGASARRAGSLAATRPAPRITCSRPASIFPTSSISSGASHASQAAVLDAQSREGLLQSLALLIQAQVAQTYLALRALDTERLIVSDTLAAYRETLALTERRWRAGDVAELARARGGGDRIGGARSSAVAPSSSTRSRC